MKAHMLFALLFAVLLGFSFFPCGTVFGQYSLEYSIQIADDGSAIWIIRQTTNNIQDPIDMLSLLQNKTVLLVENARNETGRDMAAGGFSINFSGSGPYLVEFRFEWMNFSRIEDSRIMIGDVFHVSGFFLQLYGDGRIAVSCPQGYVVESVSPAPHERYSFPQVLVWLWTLNFKLGEPSIALRKDSGSLGLMDFLVQNATPILSFVVAGSGLAGLYIFLRLRKNQMDTSKKPEPASLPGMESAEDRIVKLLESSGGSLRQTAIADNCKFSKAKASQLLAALESQGIIKRFKKGRDKIVVLQEKNTNNER